MGETLITPKWIAKEFVRHLANACVVAGPCETRDDPKVQVVFTQRIDLDTAIMTGPIEACSQRVRLAADKMIASLREIEVVQMKAWPPDSSVAGAEVRVVTDFDAGVSVRLVRQYDIKQDRVGYEFQIVGVRM